MNFSELQEKIRSADRQLIAREAQYNALSMRVEEEEREMAAASKLKELNLRTAELLKEASAKARASAIQIIENVVTHCLQLVFESHMEFFIVEDDKKKATEVQFYVTDEFGNRSNPMIPEETRGGGVVDVISIALRLALSEILKGQVGGPLLFDEPAKYVSLDYIGNLGIFLRRFSEEYHRQMIIVTHDAYLANIGNKSFSVAMQEGISDVTEVENSESVDATF